MKMLQIDEISLNLDAIEYVTGVSPDHPNECIVHLRSGKEFQFKLSLKAMTDHLNASQ